MNGISRQPTLSKVPAADRNVNSHAPFDVSDFATKRAEMEWVGRK